MILIVTVNTSHVFLYLRLSTRDPLRFLPIYLGLPVLMIGTMQLGNSFPSIRGILMPMFIACCAWTYRRLVTNDNYSRIFFCFAFVIACALVIRTPFFLVMAYGLGWPAREAERLVFFLYPVILLLLSPFLFRYVREPFRRILGIVETQKWYLVCLPPLILTSIGDIINFPSADITHEFKLRSISAILPACVVAYFASLYLFLISHRDKELFLSQRLSAAGRLEHAYEFYGRELEEKESRLRTMRHDFRHYALHLLSLARTGDLSGLTRELEDVAKMGGGIAISPFSENRTVNAVVSCHFCVAEKKGVHCVAKAFVPADLPIPEADLSLLLGNALENCVKGATPLGERGYITFSARPVRGYMAFTFENNYEPGAYATGEKAGILSIRQICERHNGRMEAVDKEGKFTLKAFVTMM